jgi:polar amino acid transport system substrate-binding protein
MNLKFSAAFLVWALTLCGISPVATADTAARPALRVGVCPTSPPMIYKQGKQMAGVEADLAVALAKYLGREVQFVELPRAELIDALDEKKIDIIMSAMSITHARQIRVAFSDPYLRVAQMALIRAEDQKRVGLLSGALDKQTIGVKKATTADMLVQQEFPRAKHKYYETGEDGARALTKKKIDLFISDSTMAWYLAGLYESQGLVLSPMMLSDEMLAWGLNRGDAELLESANAFLKQARESGELNKVLKRWIPLLK